MSKAPPPSAAYLAEDSSHGLIAVAIAFTVINTGFVILRALSQRKQRRPFALADFFSYISYVLVLTHCVIGLIMPPVAGVGRHIEYNAMHEPAKLVAALKIKYAIAVTYISAFTFPKLSILCLYLQVFAPSRRTRVGTYFLIAVVIATWIAETLTSAFQCTPVAMVWNVAIKGHCVKRVLMFQYYSIPNIVVDIAMMLLPIPAIWSLKMNKIQKLAITFTFLLGSIGLVAAIVRFVIFGDNDALKDATWASVKLQQWTIIELSMYFMAGILPTLRSFAFNTFGHLKDRVWTMLSTLGSRGSGSKNSTYAAGTRKTSTRLHSSDAIETHSEDLNLVDFGHNASRGFVKSVPADVRDSSSDTKGIKKTDEVVITHEHV